MKSIIITQGYRRDLGQGGKEEREIGKRKEIKEGIKPGDIATCQVLATRNTNVYISWIIEEKQQHDNTYNKD